MLRWLVLSAVSAFPSCAIHWSQDVQGTSPLEVEPFWLDLSAAIPLVKSDEFLRVPWEKVAPEALQSEPRPEYNNVSRLEYLAFHYKHSKEQHGTCYESCFQETNLTKSNLTAGSVAVACRKRCGVGLYEGELEDFARSVSRKEAEPALAGCKIEEPGRPCISHSQEVEDAILYQMFFRGKKGGTYLEMGALDGVRFSNSLFFEETLNWTGVLVEPSPEQFPLLEANRGGGKNHLVHKAVCPKAGVVPFQDCGATGSLSTKPRPCPNVTVQCDHLANILLETGVRELDLFSLDVEGYEFDVLQTMDWSVPVHVLLVETHRDDRKLEKLLLSKGFRYVRELRHNHVFVNGTWEDGPQHATG